jgi:hypothetical protein
MRWKGAIESNRLRSAYEEKRRPQSSAQSREVTRGREADYPVLSSFIQFYPVLSTFIRISKKLAIYLRSNAMPKVAYLALI